MKKHSGKHGVIRALAFALALWCRAAFAQAPLQVAHYDARIEPHIESRTVTGVVSVTLNRGASPGEQLVLDRGALDIDAVERGGRAVPFTLSPGKVQLSFAVAATTDQPFVIRYHGMPKFGLEFAPQTPVVYTIFSTSQWVVTEDAPSRRATWRLSIIVPRTWTVFAVGQPVRRSSISEALDVAEWRLERPVPSYTVGFAAGALTSVSERIGNVTIEFAASQLSADQLRSALREAIPMLEFFAARAGVPLPGGRYAQVLVPKTVGQEMAGLSLFSDDYGKELLDDHQSVELLAHEFAHQWWGNSVTNADWTHFWLNEGFATFMAAAFREHRFGREAYLADIDQMKARYERVRAAGHDRPLIFPDWQHPSADDRAIVYQKGGYVLHLLRQELGDDLFWKGLAVYTTTNMGRSVTTGDFKRAMQEATGRDLSTFFAKWVEGT